MPVMFTYLFKINIALLLFCLGYYLVLRHLTFYTLNRVYLLVAILFSSIYPWIDISGFVQRHQQLTAPVQHVILQWRAPAENLVKPLNEHNYWYWAEWIFWIGAILFAARLLIQLFSLYKLYRDSEPGQVYNYPVRLVDGDVSPFSFWRSIYVNPSKLSPSDLEKVLEHEQVHVSEWHTIDILLAELSTVFYWFNPGIWLMKKAVRENIEFITDHKILQKGTDSRQYQYSLLNVSMAGSTNKLVNNFNISTIKKRIIMMNAKRSSRISLGRYIFVAPAIIILLLVFSISKAGVTKRTLRNITLSLKSIGISNASQKAVPALPAIKKTKSKAGIVKRATGDTVFTAKTKDGKKNMLITSDKSLDSIGYVINGAKATRDDIKAVDPEKILSLDMMSAGDAKQFVDFQLDNKSDILFITTSDSEKGKYLKQRIDKSMHYGKLAGSSANSSVSTNITGSGKTYTNYSTVTVAGSADVAPVASGTSYSVATTSTSSSDDAPVTVSGLSGAQSKALTNVVIVGAPAKVTAVRVNGVDIAPTVDRVIVDSAGSRQVKRMNLSRDKSIVYVTGINKQVSDEPIFMVDGKQLTSLKTVSPDDIKSVVILKDEDAVKKYGEKAKNGVIVITTKKASE